MTAPTNDRREVLAAVLAEYREHMFRSEYRPEGRREYVIRSDIAQTVWQDMTRAALAAQEGERGGAEVAAAVEVRDIKAALSDWCWKDEEAPALHATTQWQIARFIAGWLDSAGALAKHDAEVLRAAADDLPPDVALISPFMGDLTAAWLLERADRTEARR